MTSDPWNLSDGLDFSDKQRRRRRKKLGGWRQLRTGAWQYRVRGYRPNGAPFILSRTCTEEQKELVELELKRQAEDYRAGLSNPARQITLSKWKKECVKSGLAWSKQNSSTWLVLKSLHGYRLESLDLSAIQKWTISTLWTGKGRPPKGKAGPGYLRHAFELLRRLLKRAVAMRVISSIPWGDETPPSIPRYIIAHKKREPLSDSDLQKILESARKCSPSIWIRVLLSAETGSRPHELSRARRSWLVPVEDVVGAPKIVGAAILSLPGAKGGLPHDVPISSDVYSEYKSWYDRLPPEARDTGALVPIIVAGKWNYPKKWLSRDSWRAICRSAGIESECVLYQLRHTRLARLANDCGPRVAQAIAGHTSVVTTERYTGRARGLVPGAFSSSLSTDPPNPTGTDSRTVREQFAVTGKSGNSVESEKIHATNVPPEALLSKLDELINALKIGLKPARKAARDQIDELSAILPPNSRISRGFRN